MNSFIKKQMIIREEETGNQGSFYIEGDGTRLAEMTFSLHDHVMVIEHTEVDKSLRGKNIGNMLVERGIEYARERQLKVDPQCPFARSVINHNKKLQDILIPN